MSASESVALVFFIVLCLGAGGLGGFWTAGSVREWYPTLRKPSWNPPSSVFGPVWTLLYLLMALAAWLVWREGRFFGLAGALFGGQLVLNIAWSYLFFYRRRPDWAFFEVIVLWASILATAASFWTVSPLAGGLFLPYLAWVSFASVLNGAIWRLNREAGTSAPI